MWLLSQKLPSKQTLKWLRAPAGIPSSFVEFLTVHDDVIKWKHFPRYWPLTRSFDVFFDLRWVNNREAGDLRRYRPHYDVTVMRIGSYVLKLLRINYPFLNTLECFIFCWLFVLTAGYCANSTTFQFINSKHSEQFWIHREKHYKMVCSALFLQRALYTVHCTSTCMQLARESLYVITPDIFFNTVNRYFLIYAVKRHILLKQLHLITLDTNIVEHQCLRLCIEKNSNVWALIRRFENDFVPINARSYWGSLRYQRIHLCRHEVAWNYDLNYICSYWLHQDAPEKNLFLISNDQISLGTVHNISKQVQNI